MSLDVLLEPVPEKQAEPCKVMRLVESLAEPYRTALFGLVNTQVADGGLSVDALAQRIRAAGLGSIGTTTLNKHRRAVCTCERVLNVR